MPLPRNQDSWEPKYPDFALNKEGSVGEAITDPETQTGGGEVPWTRAPDDSHLWGFRYHDAREIAFLRKFRNNLSLLTVRFKPSGKNPGYTEYEYEFSDHAEGERVFEMMKAAESPGEIVHSELIRKGVPYRPLHR